MLRPIATCLAGAAIATAGCGAAQPPPLSSLCTEGPDPIAQALRAAPGAVRLSDGSRISDCVTSARDEAALQDFGIVITRVADGLGERAAHDGAAAAQLGYLVGAARRGAARTNGISLELAHRVESAVRRMGVVGDEITAALHGGLRAGERTG